MTDPIGSQADAARRFKQLLPASWFKSPRPEIDAIANGFGANEAFIYTLIQYLRAQARLQTTTDGFLDLAAYDFFGAGFARRPGESDAQFAPRLIAELTRPRVTRASIISALKALTGNTPTFFEPWNTGDTGGIGRSGTFAFAGNNPGAQNGYGFYGRGQRSGFAFGTNIACFYQVPQPGAVFGGVGAFGSVKLRDQFFITMPRPGQQGVPNIAGFNTGGGGVGKGAFAFASLSQIVAAVTDQNIYDTINATKAAGTTAWVALTGVKISNGDLNSDFNTDFSGGGGSASAMPTTTIFNAH